MRSCRIECGSELLVTRKKGDHWWMGSRPNVDRKVYQGRPERLLGIAVR